MSNHDRNNVPYMQKACAKKVTIFSCQIDAGLRFPYGAALVELCQHFQITPTQLSPNVIRSWVGLISYDSNRVGFIIFPFSDLSSVFNATPLGFSISKFIFLLSKV